MSGLTEFRVLGRLELVVEGECRALGGPRAEQVLAVLLANRRGSVSIDRLIEAVWADGPPPSATATTQSLVSRLRALVPTGTAIVLDSAGYRLAVPRDAVDADRFEALVVRGRDLEPGQAIPILESALELCVGPAFGPYAGLDDVRAEALRLDELELVANDLWVEARLAMGDPASVVGDLSALIERHPLRESFRRLLMLALYRSGRQGEALRAASDFRDLLATEMGLDLPPAVRALEAKVLADDPGLREGMTPPEPPRAHRMVRAQLLGATSFVGRDDDVLSVSASLAHEPLITVTGPGGVGKTRLAMRVAAGVFDGFDDGVVVVEFAPLRDRSGVAQVLAQALDIQQRQSRSLEATIEDHLATRQCLLLLDNCEHVADTLAPIVDHLRSTCPRLRILATSREPLGLPGEFVRALAPLSLPAPDVVTASDVGSSSAVQMLVLRADAATGGFVLADGNAGAVADICRRLEGLPLALELAAARLRSIGVDALAERLNDRTELAGQLQRGADHRHRTLHDLVRWSHELLDPHEQSVFDQLSVFTGGFDLSAAESVCSVGQQMTPVMGTLAGLVEKSMVVFLDPGPPRYRLLEPLREFGQDRLRESGTRDAIEQRHLEWFLDLAEQAAIGLDTPDEAEWSATLDRNFGNLRAAHRTAIDSKDVDRSLRLVTALHEFASRRIRYEVEGWADTAIGLPGSAQHSDWAAAIGISAYGRFVRGDMDAAVELAERALDRAHPERVTDSGIPERVLGNTHYYLNEIVAAEEAMRRMLDSARRSGSVARVAHALFMTSVGLTSIGETIRGAILAGEAKAAADLAGSPTASAQADYALGLAYEHSDPDSALSHLEQAARKGAGAGNRWIEAFALTEVHWLRARSGDWRAALLGYAEVIETWYRGGDWANQWLSLRRVLAIMIDLSALEASAVLYGSLTAAGAAEALPFEPGDAAQLAANVDQLAKELGHPQFDVLARAGAAMRDREIVDFVKEQIAIVTAAVPKD